MKTCTVSGCNRKHLAKGLCNSHYLRVYRRGTLDLKVKHGAPAVDRILDRVEKRDGCWIFQGTLTERGYGHVRDGRRMRMAHVILFEEKYGAVPAGLELDHTCRHRACCNPDHLEPVTHAENVRRGLAGHDWALRERNTLGQFAADKRLI